MEISPMIFWNVILTLVIAPALWTARSMIAEMKRIDILLNKTREEYASRSDVKEEMKVVHIEMERYVKRLEYMLERTTNDVRVDWVNAETQMSILSQHGYKKDSARLSDMGKTSTDKDEKITGRIEKLLQHGKVEKLDYSGFE